MDFERAIEILGVDAEADLNAARRAYLRLIRVHRPESDPEGFRRVREAWEAFEEGYTPPAPDGPAEVVQLEIKLPNDLLFEARDALEAEDLEGAVALGERALSMRESIDLDHVAFLLLSLWGESADDLACRLMEALEERLRADKPRSHTPPMAMILDLWRNHKSPEARVERALVLLGRRKRIDGLLDRFDAGDERKKGQEKSGRQGNAFNGSDSKQKERFRPPVDPYNKLT